MGTLTAVRARPNRRPRDRRTDTSKLILFSRSAKEKNLQDIPRREVTLGPWSESPGAKNYTALSPIFDQAAILSSSAFYSSQFEVLHKVVSLPGHGIALGIIIQAHRGKYERRFDDLPSIVTASGIHSTAELKPRCLFAASCISNLPPTFSLFSARKSCRLPDRGA